MDNNTKLLADSCAKSIEKKFDCTRSLLPLDRPEWSAALTLRREPSGYFHSACYTGGRAMRSPRVKLSL